MKNVTTYTKAHSGLRLGSLAGVVVGAIAMSGCASTFQMGESSHSCPYPDGDHCMTLEDAYEKATAKSDLEDRVGEDAARQSARNPASMIPQQLPSGAPILSEPQVLRVWFGPWEDRYGQLHDQNYIYTVVRDGQWLLKRNHTAEDDRYINLKSPDASPLVLKREHDDKRAATRGQTRDEIEADAKRFLNGDMIEE